MFLSKGLKPTETPRDPAYTDLVAMVEARIGICVQSTLFTRLQMMCEARLRDLGLNRVGEYIELLRDGSPEWLRVVSVVSVGESHFYRDRDRWQALSDHILPALFADAAKGSRSVRILSAGCSTGEEVYGLAAVCERVGFVFPGVTVDAEAISAAQRGVYTHNALRGVSPDLLETLFSPHDPPFRVRDGLRRWVRFETRNLLDGSRGEGPQSAFDLVLCQNVVIYFSRRTTQRVVDALADAVRPGGMLLMGHSEALTLPTGFKLSSVGKSYGFRNEREVPAQTNAWCVKPNVSRAGAMSASDLAWAAVERGDYVAAKRAIKAIDLGVVGLAPEVRHLAAWIHCCLGELEIAQRLVKESLAVTDTKPELHFVRGVLAHGNGDVAVARDCFRRAVFLDPSFAAAHFHLAAVQRETGRHDQAKRSWRNAVQSAHNDQTRVRRYGGGFDVSTFIQACEAGMTSSLGAG